MEKLLKRIIASFMCFSLLTLQLSFAADKDGMVLPGVGGNPGANIVDSAGGFIGFEKPNDNEANLNFNGDAVINWGHLNVGSGQILNFLNGNYAVLNNVLNGMSTFAGQITGGTGAIIISNPNGMLMTGSGASIVTNGTLILTTKDLYNIDNNSYFDAAGKLIYGKDNALDLINNASYSDQFNIISLNNGSITAGNINILAKGIDIYNANLTSTKDGGNIVLKTTDGANFIGYEVKRDENNVPISITGKTDNNNFSASINVDHNSVIKTNNGNIEIIANNSNKNNSVYVADSTLTGKTNITTNNGDLQFCGNTQQGNLTTNINGFSELYKDTVLGDVNLTSTDRIDVRDMSAYDANLLSTNGFITLSGINDFDGEFIAKTTGLDPTNSYIAIGNTLNNGSSPLEDGSFIYTTLDADNVTLIAENGNIGLAGVITADGKINITANNGSIYSAQGAISGVQNILNAKEYNLFASGDIGSVKVTDTSVEPGKGIGFNFTETIKGRKNPTFDELGSLSIAGHDDSIKGPNNTALYNEVNIKADNANIKADGNIKLNKADSGKNVSNNLITETEQALDLNGVSSGKDMTITAGGPITGWASAGNDMSLNSDSFMYIDTMYAGNEFNAIAKGYIDLYNLSAKNANLISENDAVILTGTDNNIIENFYAKGKTYVAIGNTYNDGIALEDKIFIPTELNAKNVTLVSENGNIGLAGIINADETINITANNGSIYSADYAIPVGKNILNAKEYNLTASGDIGSIQPTNPSVDPGKGKGYNFTETIKGRRTPTFDELGSISIAGHDDSIKGPDGALYNEVNIKADNANIKADGNIKLNKADSGKNVSNNLITETEQALDLNGVSSGKDMTITAGGPITGWASAGNDMSLNSDSFMYIDTMYAGNEFNAIAKGYIDLYNLSAKNANLISTGDGVILTGTNNNITENFYANGKTYVAIGNTINGGSNPEDYAFEPTKLNAKNVTLVTENGNIGLAGVINADDSINITANNGSIYSAENSIPVGESILNAQKYNLTAGKNVASIEPTDANLASGSIGLDFTEAVKGQNKNPQSFGSLSINGGDVKLQVGNNVDIKAKNNLNINNSTVGNNLVAESTDGHVAVKYADVDGNTNLTAKNGVKIWFSDFAKDLTAKFTGDHSVKVPDDAMQTDPPHDVYIAYSQVHGNAELKAPNASDAQITVSNTTIDNNLDAQSAGSVVLWQANVGKHVNAKADNGSISLSGLDKRTEVGSLTANAKQNIIINNSDIKGNANLNAGLDIRSTNSSYVGNIIANAKNGSFKDSKGDLKFYNTNIENKLSANTDGNISLDSNANNVNESLMNKIGSIDFETEDGNIKIWDTNVSNDTKLTSNKGNILLADSYTNTANITNNEGNISVSNVKANTVNTTNNISGETVISSKGNKINDLNSIAKGNAKVTLNNASVGNANLNSQNGNISINSTKADNITATSTENGKISMMYSNITGKFKANANNGDIVLDADESKMNQTVGSLDLKTENGNINIWDTKVTNTAKLNAKNGNILSSNANYGGNITADAKNAIFDSSKAGKLNFVDSNITGNLKATADNKVALNNSTVGGKFTGKSNNYETTVNHSTVGSAELTSKWNNSFNNSTSNGDIKMSSEGGHSTINASTIKGSAELTAKGNAAINGSTVDGAATVSATDGKASIWESIVGKKATVTSENYEAAIGAGEGKTSQVGSAEIKSKWNNRLYNTTVNESAKLTSTNGHSSVSNATIKGNAELTAKGNAAINGSTVDGNATVKATDGKASIWESIVGKKATVTSENYEAAIGAGEGKTSQVGSAEIKSKWNNRLYNTTVNGDAKLTSTNGNSSVSNATIKGNAELTAKVSAAVSDSNIESNATVQSETGKASIYKSSVTGIAKVTSSKNEVAIGESQVGTADMYGETGARFYNSKSNGELKIKANTGDVNITNATVRNVNATSHKANINVKNTETTGESRNHFTAKNGNVTSTNSNYIGSIKAEVGKTADFNTDKNITFDYVSADKLNVVSNNENIGIIGNIIADKINLTATNGSIYATTNALLDGNTYNLKALNQIASLDDISDVMNKTDYDWSLQKAINIAGGTVETLSAGIASVHSNGNVTFVTPETTKGNLRLSSDGDLKINKGANVAGNLLTQADGSITTSGNIMAGFDVKAYATDDINIENVNAGRNLELKSNKGNINLGNDSKASSVSGKTTLTADKDINVKNYTSTDSFNATSNNGAITLNKASVGNRAIPAGQYKGITLNAKKDITVNNSYSHGKFIANSTQGSVSVGNTGVETQGSDITAGKDVNLNQFHSAAHVNITAGENVNAKAIGTSANQSIWTVKAGKDANFENLNLNNKNGALNVEANNININNAPSVGIKPNVQGQVDLKANNDIKIENGTEFGSKLNATAGNNISLDRKGDLTINNSSPISLKAGNTVSVSTDGQLVIDNLTSNDIVNGTNVNFAGANITTNNSTYHTNVGMDSKGDVTFTGSNTINGDLTISASKDSGFVAINGDSTKANNITVNGAQYIESKNVETGHLQFNDFEIGHIINTTADSTGFTNGNDLYVNVLNTIINSGELRPSITGSAIDVDRIIFYPTFPEGGDGTNLDGLDEDSALILGYLRDKAIETKLGSDFAPIGFAAHEGRRGGLHRMDIGDSVYRALQENIDTLHITDRFNIDQ